jgi:hypothetical protein
MMGAKANLDSHNGAFVDAGSPHTASVQQTERVHLIPGLVSDSLSGSVSQESRPTNQCFQIATPRVRSRAIGRDPEI